MITISKELAGPHAIATRALEKRYGKVRALAGVDLTVPEGSMYVLVGQNGVGKTTTFEALLGLVVTDGGSAHVLGLDCGSEPARVRAQIGWVPEKADDAYGWIRVGQLIRYHAAFHHAWDDAYAA